MFYTLYILFISDVDYYRTIVWWIFRGCKYVSNVDDSHLVFEKSYQLGDNKLLWQFSCMTFASFFHLLIVWWYPQNACVSIFILQSREEWLKVLFFVVLKRWTVCCRDCYIVRYFYWSGMEEMFFKFLQELIISIHMIGPVLFKEWYHSIGHSYYRTYTTKLQFDFI